MGSNYFVDNYLIPEELKRARASFQGAFILDGIMNYNDNSNTQELPLDYTEVKIIIIFICDCIFKLTKLY